jgi:Lon protease-like protein
MGVGVQRIALADLSTERDPLPIVEEAFWEPGRSGLFLEKRKSLAATRV